VLGDTPAALATSLIVGITPPQVTKARSPVDPTDQRLHPRAW
jgi:hypothetical protein